MTDTVERYIDIHGDDVVEELSSLVSVPSVSAQRDHGVDVRRCCEYLVDRMTQSGLTARLVETSGHPVAFGRRFVGDHLPNVLVYCHYDVQPAHQSEGWAAPPFQASVENERVYGRGVSDDKGHIAAHLVAIKAILACRRELPVNLELLFEGEEEIGSPHFEQAIETELAGINPDVIVISDTPMYAADVPALTVSLRGIVVWEVTVSGSHDDLHSGLYGGIVQNPIDALARILTSLQDADGCIAVPGFYDGVEDVDPAYLADLRTLDYDEAVVSEQLGVPELRHEPTHAALECLWYRPTIDCNGIYGGYAGEGRKTIIPHCATAKLSSRLVQGQDPDRIASLVSRFIVENAPRGVRVDVTHEVGNPAVRAPIDHPAVAAAKRSVEAVFGRRAALIGNGGSIGAASVFARRFSCPQIMLGFGLPTDAIHAPNEHVDVWRLVNGAKTIARFYDELAAR